ncbi:MAG TPA: hypothetical protein VH916_13580 [Dehalococcoidia bacterium]
MTTPPQSTVLSMCWAIEQGRLALRWVDGSAETPASSQQDQPTASRTHNVPAAAVQLAESITAA